MCADHRSEGNRASETQTPEQVKTYGTLWRLEVMALRTRSVRFFRLMTAMSILLWTSGCDRASPEETSYGKELLRHTGEPLRPSNLCYPCPR